MNGDNLEDYRWLVSPEAKRYLEIAAQDNGSLVRVTLALRKELGPTRTHLVIAQTELRRRATVKFRDAQRMFFTRQLLEQATDEQIAVYKAGRLAENEAVVDLCCGIGGDLLGLARRGPVDGVDWDPVALLLAQANCEAAEIAHARLVDADVTGWAVAGYDAWHLDPDRRPEGERTTHVELHSPGMETIERLRSENRKGAVKLAPAGQLPERGHESAEREWIGNRRECRQQVIWYDTLARFPGEHVATVFGSGSREPCTIHGLPHKTQCLAERLERFVYEPHAAVLAARLSGTLAEKHGLPAVSQAIPYFTSDRVIDDPAMCCFEVLEELPLDPKIIRKAVRSRSIGNLEVKKRGVRLDPEDVRRQINPRGDESGTLIFVPVRSHPTALLTRRLTHVDPGAAADAPHASEG